MRLQSCYRITTNFGVAYSSSLITSIEPNPADNDWQIVFRHTVMDLSQFTCSYDGGESTYHIPDRGIMVLLPKSRKVPAVARLEYWFQSRLESGDTVTHLFVMEGVFYDPDNWPPTVLEFSLLKSVPVIIC